MDRDQAIKLMQELLKRVVERQASDLFITAGFPPAIKVDGEIRPQMERALTAEQSAMLVRAIMNDRQTQANSTPPRNAISRSRRPASAAFASVRSCSRATSAASSA